MLPAFIVLENILFFILVRSKILVLSKIVDKKLKQFLTLSLLCTNIKLSRNINHYSLD